MLSLLEFIPSILVTVVVTFGFLWILYPAWVALVADILEWDVEELSSADTQRPQPPLLSLIIPAYNEQDRIPIMIRESFEYLTSERGKTLIQQLQSCSKMMSSDDNSPKEQKQPEEMQPVIEWLIVNDGSNDSTCDIVRETYTSIPSDSTSIGWKWKIVSLKRNAGKGAAVKTGMHLAEGTFHLMVDADGATEFGNGLENLTRELSSTIQKRQIIVSNKENNEERSIANVKDLMIAIFGSRAHLEKKSTVQRSMIRTILMKAFHFFVSMFVSSKVQDTQCGFKLFTQSASCLVFKNLHLRRWAFDTEIILLCDKQGIEILEVAVPWHEVDGSKLSTSKLALALVSISMLRDMICVRACYTFGLWKIKNGLSSSQG
jgi:dolichyl-phosphate beta-glucosyltransferase